VKTISRTKKKRKERRAIGLAVVGGLRARREKKKKCEDQPMAGGGISKSNEKAWTPQVQTVET